jgi:hypothetical protein|tara:strand:+ start:160 stop:663 length:504 start_codon:yes stop_codon:yes gene_type:complete
MGNILEGLCAPALIYLVFMLTQVILDIYKNVYNKAVTNFVTMILFTLLLNILCSRGLDLVAWIIVAAPIIYMAFISSYMLYIFNLNDKDSEVVDDDNSSTSSDIITDDGYDSDSSDENNDYVDDSIENGDVEYANTVYILPGQTPVKVKYSDVKVQKLYENPNGTQY